MSEAKQIKNKLAKSVTFLPALTYSNLVCCEHRQAQKNKKQYKVPIYFIYLQINCNFIMPTALYLHLGFYKELIMWFYFWTICWLISDVTLNDFFYNVYVHVKLSVIPQNLNIRKIKTP